MRYDFQKWWEVDVNPSKQTAMNYDIAEMHIIAIQPQIFIHEMLVLYWSSWTRLGIGCNLQNAVGDGTTVLAQ